MTAKLLLEASLLVVYMWVPEKFCRIIGYKSMVLRKYIGIGIRSLVCFISEVASVFKDRMVWGFGLRILKKLVRKSWDQWCLEDKGGCHISLVEVVL